ncbi:MAG TPA: hypothetical protein VGO83_10865 [Thermoleophilaceae bacterium]|jgi:hypothetical protein|nr:hypothetical protein [Thermoleophilaceae bacterium]
MKTFLLDLWLDLREKRLAPVAVVLLVALLAVPVVLAKPAKDPGPAPALPAPKKADNDRLAALTKVKLGEEAVGKGSTLGIFDPDNPFTPPKGTIKADATGTPSTGPVVPGGAITPGGATTGGTGGTDPGTTGGTPPSGGGGGTTTTTTTTVYKYVVDLTFAANGRTRKIKGMEKLDMLPNDSAPLLIFMGVTSKGSNAVFLVDSSLKAAGEGRCKPSESKCAFAYIGPGSEYVFTEEDGDTYTIRIDEIRKVKAVTTAKGSSAKGARAHAAVGSSRRFVSPMFADEVVVASESVQNSSADTNSR